MGINPREIGNRIKAERQKLNYTQEQFAELLSIGRVHLANIEGGRKMASIDLLVSMCEILSCSLDYLVLGGLNPKTILKNRISNAILLLQSAYDELY